MTSYTTPPANLETGVGGSRVGERTVVVIEKSSSLSWVTKVCVVVFLMVLCVPGAVLSALYLTGRPQSTVQPGQTEEMMDEATGVQSSLKGLGSTPAVHLEGFYKGGQGLSGQLVWREDQDHAFVQGGFQLKDNHIIVPRSGLYFVYSQVSFRVTCNHGDLEEAGPRVTTLSHAVWLYSDSMGSEASLLSAERLACQWVASGYSIREFNAIYLGAAFQLNKGDRLWTETSQLTQLDYETGKNFFGVFSL